MFVACNYTKFRILWKLCLDLKSVQIKRMLDVNTQNLQKLIENYDFSQLNISFSDSPLKTYALEIQYRFPE
jgi:hypothetical protein